MQNLFEKCVCFNQSYQKRKSDGLLSTRPWTDRLPIKQPCEEVEILLLYSNICCITDVWTELPRCPINKNSSAALSKGMCSGQTGSACRLVLISRPSGPACALAARREHGPFPCLSSGQTSDNSLAGRLTCRTQYGRRSGI